MSDTSRQGDWTKPAAMAIPKGGYFKDEVEQGRYGPTSQDFRVLWLLDRCEGYSRKGRSLLRSC